HIIPTIAARSFCWLNISSIPNGRRSPCRKASQRNTARRCAEERPARDRHIPTPGLCTLHYTVGSSAPRSFQEFYAPKTFSCLGRHRPGGSTSAQQPCTRRCRSVYPEWFYE